MIGRDSAVRLQQREQFIGLRAHQFSEPRASTLSRIKGSVFEVRRLKRQSLNSNETPSVRSRRGPAAHSATRTPRWSALASGTR
jgi:hypothetical protein